MPEKTAYTPGEPCWTDLGTPEPVGAREFYGALFDWEFDLAGDEYGGYAVARIGPHRVAGIMPGADDVPAMWNTYFAVADADATAERVTRAGGQVAMGPMDVADHGRALYATDPNGAGFGVWQAGHHPGSTLELEHGTRVWSELATRDLPVAERFYEAVFAFGLDPIETPGGAAYRILTVGGLGVGGILQMTDAWPDALPSQWVSYFQVDSTDAVVDAARALDATVVVEPFDSPYGRISVLHDPQGAAFSLIEPRRA